jgi:Tannase and feruloyl esterase
MKIKLSSTLACTAVLAFAPGAGDTGRAGVDAAPPGAAACTALATAQFATVTALSTADEAGSTTQRPHCVVRGSAAPHTGVDGMAYETRFELRLPTAWNGRFLYQGGGGNDGAAAPAGPYLRFYNHRRPHAGLGRRSPWMRFQEAA